MSKPQRPSGMSATFVVEPSAAHTHTFILLHGLGSHGEKFGSELLETGVSSTGQSLTELFPGARFVFPTSRKRRSTAFRRCILTQWFDMARLSQPSYRQELQLQGLAESGKDVMRILINEMKKVSHRNIILGGLSQGCAMSLAVLLCLQFPIGGFIGMSGWLCYQPELRDAVLDDLDEDDDGDDCDLFFCRDDDEDMDPQEAILRSQAFERDLLGLNALEHPRRQATSLETPVFLAHGSEDEKIPCALGEAVVPTLREAEYQVKWKCYEGQGHCYKIPEGIDDIVEFLRLRVVWDGVAPQKAPQKPDVDMETGQ